MVPPLRVVVVSGGGGAWSNAAGVEWISGAVAEPVQPERAAATSRPAIRPRIFIGILLLQRGT